MDPHNYMKLPIANWPINQNYDTETIDTISKRVDVNLHQIYTADSPY